MQLEVAMLSYAGLACWALSTKRLRRELAYPRLPAPPTTRATAAVLLAVAAWRAVCLFGPYQGAVAWIGLLSVSGVALVLLASIWPRLAISVAAGAILIVAYSLAGGPVL